MIISIVSCFVSAQCELINEDYPFIITSVRIGHEDTLLVGEWHGSNKIVSVPKQFPSRAFPVDGRSAGLHPREITELQYKYVYLFNVLFMQTRKAFGKGDESVLGVGVAAVSPPPKLFNVGLMTLISSLFFVQVISFITAGIMTGHSHTRATGRLRLTF